MQILVRRVSEKPNFKVRKPRGPKFIRMSFIPKGFKVVYERKSEKVRQE